jgi:ABC-type lipoprotein release transport system permease subunit
MPAAKKMLGLKNSISEISILLPDRCDNSKVALDIKNALPSSDYEVHTWQELLHILTAYLEMFDQFMYIWFVIVFIAMGFGIVNTTLMAVFERMREFGLLKALGMKPWWIVRSVIHESVLLLIMGMSMGNLLAFACIQVLSKTGLNLSYLAEGADYFGIDRIIFPDLYFQDVFVANFVVLILGVMVSVYPAIRAARFTPVEALAHT